MTTTIRKPYDEDGNQIPGATVHWDLSFGCRINFGYEDGELHVTVCVSDTAQRDGIVAPSVTPSQLAEFVRQLRNLVEPNPVYLPGERVTVGGVHSGTVEPPRDAVRVRLDHSGLVTDFASRFIAPLDDR